MSSSPMPAIAVDIAVEAGDWGDESEIGTQVDRVLATAVAIGGFDLPASTELSLVLTDDAHIQDLNRLWRGKDKPTNVLSFPGDDDEPGSARPLLLGDIVIARETLVREAADETKTVTDHFCHLLVHGFMHLMGYDHENEGDAVEMETLETEILAALGVSDPYSEPAA